MSLKLDSKQVSAAAHTLWQAAVASGGIGEILKSVTDHSVNIPGAEQGAVVAGVAVGGAVLSLAKSYAINAAEAWKVKSAKNAAKADEIEKIVKQVVSAYEAQHAVTVAPASAVVTVGGVPVTDPPTTNISA